MSIVADHYVIKQARQHGFFLLEEISAQAEVAREALQACGVVTAETLSDAAIIEVAVSGCVSLDNVGEGWSWYDPDTDQSREGFASMAEAARDAVMTLELELE